MIESNVKVRRVLRIHRWFWVFLDFCEYHFATFIKKELKVEAQITNIKSVGNEQYYNRNEINVDLTNITKEREIQNKIKKRKTKEIKLK